MKTLTNFGNFIISTISMFLLIVALFSCGPSARDREEFRIADSIRVSDSIAMVKAEQNQIPSTEIIKSRIIGKWVLDSFSFVPTMPEQADPKYLKGKGRVNSDGKVVLFNQKRYSKKGDDFQSYEFGDNKLIIRYIYDAPSKHFDQTSILNYEVQNDNILCNYSIPNGRKFEFHYKILELTENTLIFDSDQLGGEGTYFLTHSK